MKKKLYLFIIFVMIVSLAVTGCGKDQTPEIEEKVSVFLNAMEEGDLAAIEASVDPAVWGEGGDLEFLASVETFSEDFLASLGVVTIEDLSEDSIAAIEQFRDFLLDNMVESYEIGTIAVDKDTAVAEAVINYGFALQEVPEADVHDGLVTLINDYMKNNQEELISVLNYEGEDALQVRIVNDLIGDIIDLYTDAILKQDGFSESTVIFLDKIDGAWVITGVKAKN